MLEVLISVVVLAFGMLGIASMQLAALRNSQSSLERNQATTQTYAILDAMRANLSVARIGGYNLTTMTCAVPNAGTLAQNDLHNWITSLKATMGDSACAKVVCGGVDCEISVQWNDSRGKGGALEQVITTRTRL
ncbi:type IV pilus modification protein PilV [Lysobacter fragariae]